MENETVKNTAAVTAENERTSGASHENHNYRRHRSLHESGSGTGAEQELESLRIEGQGQSRSWNPSGSSTRISLTEAISSTTKSISP